MIVSRLEFENTYYYSLHAEQAVTSTFIEEPGIGVYEEILTFNTLERVVVDFAKNQEKVCLLDFNNLVSCQNNLNSLISKLKGNCKLLVLFDLNNEILEKLEVGIFKNPNNELNKTGKSKFIVSDTSDYSLPTFDFFQSGFEEILLKHFSKKSNVFHHSSSVYLNGYIDVKSMISLEKAFVIFAIYKLAMKTKDHWSQLVKSRNVSLVCQNLNSSYLASILSSFLNLDIVIIDKLGPINKLYNSLGSKIENGRKYIVVSDLVCLGTEVKIAKNLINFMGGDYTGNISLLRIETIRAETKIYDDTECVYKISNENNKLGYKIFTSLDLNV